ncbi:hypothetical protein Hanom_Chr12g01141531 [Helianthus anomalus]
MGRVPIQKALTDQRPLYRSHIERFWNNASYDDQHKVISSIVEVHGKMENILVTEALICEVVNFADDAESPTRFLEKNRERVHVKDGISGSFECWKLFEVKVYKAIQVHYSLCFDIFKSHKMRL